MSEEQAPKAARRSKVERALDIVQEMTLDQTVEFVEKMSDQHVSKLKRVYGDLKRFGKAPEETEP